MEYFLKSRKKGNRIDFIMTCIPPIPRIHSLGSIMAEKASNSVLNINLRIIVKTYDISSS